LGRRVKRQRRPSGKPHDCRIDKAKDETELHWQKRGQEMPLQISPRPHFFSLHYPNPFRRRMEEVMTLSQHTHTQILSESLSMNIDVGISVCV